MHKSIVGSHFMEVLSVTVVVFLRENALNAMDPVAYPGYLGGAVVRALDFWSSCCGFNF